MFFFPPVGESITFNTLLCYWSSVTYSWEVSACFLSLHNSLFTFNVNDYTRVKEQDLEVK